MAKSNENRVYQRVVKEKQSKGKERKISTGKFLIGKIYPNGKYLFWRENIYH